MMEIAPQADIRIGRPVQMSSFVWDCRHIARDHKTERVPTGGELIFGLSIPLLWSQARPPLPFAASWALAMTSLIRVTIPTTETVAKELPDPSRDDIPRPSDPNTV